MLAPLAGARREKAPREHRPKPQPSRGSRSDRCRAGDPTPFGSRRRPKPTTGAHWTASIRGPLLSGDRSPRFQGGADPKIRRSDGRSTIPKDPRSVFRPPRASVSRCSGHPHRGNSSRLDFRRSVPTVRAASGSPLWRPGKVDHGPAHRKRNRGFVFAICDPVFADASHGADFGVPMNRWSIVPSLNSMVWNSASKPAVDRAPSHIAVGNRP